MTIIDRSRISTVQALSLFDFAPGQSYIEPASRSRSIPGLPVSRSTVGEEPTRRLSVLLLSGGSFRGAVGDHSLTEVEAMTRSVKKTPLISATAAAGLLLGFAWAWPAMANAYAGGDGPIACQDFQRGSNGSWMVLHATTISSGGVQLNVTPGQSFTKNQFVGGIEPTTVLDRNCGNE
jgi:hypothetical protein